MSEKGKNKKGRGRPSTGRTPTSTIFARVPPPLAQALESYMESLRPRPTTTALVIAALEDYLEAKGHWPPERHEEGEDG